MATSQAQKLAVQKYRAKTYDTIGFDVKKGKREEYKSAAAELGLSLAALLTNAAEEFIQRHAGEVNLPAQTAPITTPEEKISDREKKILNAVNQLPSDAQKSLLKFLQSLSNVAATDKTAENTAKNASVDNHEPI